MKPTVLHFHGQSIEIISGAKSSDIASSIETMARMMAACWHAIAAAADESAPTGERRWIIGIMLLMALLSSQITYWRWAIDVIIMAHHQRLWYQVIS